MNRNTVFELFGEMRHSTPEEQALYREMLKKHSTIIKGINIFEMNKEPAIIEGINIFDMSNIEIDYCDICHEKTQVNRKYYHYPIKCECCGGTTHFEIVRYCNNCTPKPPHWIKAIVTPIEELKNE